MTQIIAGQATDLTKTIAELVRDLLYNNWPTATYDPVRADVDFGMETWNDYGDIDIHVTAEPATSRPLTIGWLMSQVIDPVLISLYVRKNQQTIPTSSLGGAQRKIEEIIKDNAASLGQGVQMLRFDGWGRLNEGNTIKDVWRINGRASAIYFRVKST